MVVQDNISPKQGVSLRLKAIHKHYGSLHVLDGIDIELRQQEILTVLGPSGCGKTTLLRIVNGLISYDKGEVLFKGEQVMRPRPEMAMVFQNFGLFPWKRLHQNIGYGLRIQRRSLTEIDKIVAHYIGLVGLNGFEDNFPAELSGGMQQRAGLARALAVQPALAMKKRRALGQQVQIQRKSLAGHVQAHRGIRVGGIFPRHHAPTAEPDLVPVDRRPGHAQATAGNPAAVEEDPFRRFAERGLGRVRRFQPPARRRPLRWLVRAARGARHDSPAKEGHLDSKAPPAGRLQPAGVIPPLQPVGGVNAVVPGEIPIPTALRKAELPGSGRPDGRIPGRISGGARAVRRKRDQQATESG